MKSSKCPKHLLGSMPYAEPKKLRWLKKRFDRLPREQRQKYIEAAKKVSRKSARNSERWALRLYENALCKVCPGIEAIDPRAKVFDSLEIIRSIDRGIVPDEAIGFRKGEIVWTDGKTVKPMTVKRALAWFAKWEILFDKARGLKFDMTSSDASGRFLKSAARLIVDDYEPTRKPLTRKEISFRLFTIMSRMRK